MTEAPFALTQSLPRLSASDLSQLLRVESIADACRSVADVKMVTEHLIHGGMYARTIRVKAGVIFTSVLIKIPTIVIVHGHLAIDGVAVVAGYGVLAGSAFRKKAYATLSDVEMTMIFPTQAKTVTEAEAEFTDEPENLMSQHSTSDTVMVTGE